MRQWTWLGVGCFLLGMSVTGSARADDEDELHAAYIEAKKLETAAKYSEAEPLYKKATQLAAKVYGENNQSTARILNDLAMMYATQGKYTEAVPFFQRSLSIYEKIFGKEHPAVAASLINLASLYWKQEKYAEAERLILRSLSVNEKVHGKEHPEVANSLNNLAILCMAQRKFAEADLLYHRCLSVNEKVHGKEHPNVATALNNLAVLYNTQGKYAEAEPLYFRSLNISEKVYGKAHPNVATALNNLANQFKDQGKYAEAEPLYIRSLSISENALGKEHPEIATTLNNMAILYAIQRKYVEAEPLYQRSLSIIEKVHGKEHPAMVLLLSNLGSLYGDQGKYAEAVSLYQRSLSIIEKVHGKEHPEVALPLNNLATLYHIQGKYADAESLFQRILSISKKSLGMQHPSVATYHDNLANVYADGGKIAEATSLFTQLRQNTRQFLLRELPSMSVREQQNYLNLNEKGRFARTLTIGYRQAKDATIVEPSAAWLLNGKAIAFEAQTIRGQLEREVTDAEGKGTLREIQAIRAQEAALALKAGTAKQLDAIVAQREQLENRRRELEKKLAQRSGTAAKLANPWVELADVRRKIPADGVLIDIARFTPYRYGVERGEKRWDAARYVAWVIPVAGKGDIRIVDLGEADPIDAAIQAARAAIEKAPARLKKEGEEKVEADAAAKLAAVSKLVFEPLQPNLGQAKKLILSPDGDLWLLPWAALPIGKDRYLIEEYSLRFVVTGRDLVENSVGKKPVTSAPLILADPDYDLGPAQVALVGRDLLRGSPTNPDKLRLFGRRCVGTIEAWNVSFEFAESGQVVIRDEDNGGSLAGEATWTLDGGQLTMKSAISTFTGRLTAMKASGERVKESDGTTTRDRWEFRLPAEVLAREGESRSVSLESKSIPKAPRLPGTVPEARQAFAKLKALTGQEPKLYKEAEASEAIVKATPSPLVLVLATHGYFLKKQEVEIKDDRSLDLKSEGEKRSAPLVKDKNGQELENPLLRCGLLLAGANKRTEAKEGEDDGILTGLEIVGLDLRGTQMVVLSACETGVGDVQTGEGVAGLRQAFQLAGAESVMATLWQISDEATVRLMNTFYDELAKGTDRSEALTRAQRQFLKERRERFGAAHPYYWASFTLTGK